MKRLPPVPAVDSHIPSILLVSTHLAFTVSTLRRVRPERFAGALRRERFAGERFAGERFAGERFAALRRVRPGFYAFGSMYILF